MSCLDNHVFGSVYQFLLLMSKVSPEDKYNPGRLVAQGVDNLVRELLPPILGMGVWFVSPENQVKKSTYMYKNQHIINFSVE